MIKFAITLCLLLSVSVFATSIRVDPETSLFIDQFNNTRVFHGLNVVYKLAPFYPPSDVFDSQTSFVEEDAQNLKAWGFNSIRLFMAWEGFEPQRQVYNYTYLGELKRIIELCLQYDIYVYLDAHQDLYSRFFCGEGMPDWTVSKVVNSTFPFPYPSSLLQRDDHGYPLIPDCLKLAFGMYYLTPAVGQQGQNLFTNVRGLADDFANMWGEVAKYFSAQTHLTNLLGYEIINEPTGESPWNSLKEFLWPGVGDNKILYPFYQKVAAKIRENDPEALIFYEPTVEDFLSGGFNNNLGHPEKEVFSYHVYCIPVNAQGDPYSRAVCDIVDTVFIEGKEKNLKKIHVGGFMTEFGALSNSTASAKELNFLLNKADQHLRSWSYWQYKGYDDITTAAAFGSEGFYNKDGSFQSNKAKHLARPYAPTICGTNIEKSAFNPVLEILELKYTSIECGTPTQIFLSPLFWFDTHLFVVMENVKQILQNHAAPGYYFVFPKEVGQVVHLVVTKGIKSNSE